jgi:acetyltransferase EpsM
VTPLTGTRPKLVVWGASGHALVIADVIRQLGTYDLVGFLDDVNSERRWLPRHGARVLGGREQIPGLLEAGVQSVIIGVGDCEARLRLADVARAAGLSLATAVHPRATLAGDVEVGRGTLVCAGVIVQPGSSIGENAILNTAATVDHECIIHDGAHVGPGAHLGGNVVVGRGAWVGIGAIVSNDVSIGARAVLGAGSVLVRDLPAAVVAFGVPATVRRESITRATAG